MQQQEGGRKQNKSNKQKRTLKKMKEHMRVRLGVDSRNDDRRHRISIDRSAVLGRV